MKENTKAILLVDDDEEDRMLLQDAFDDLGYGSILKQAQNGEEALVYLKGLPTEALPSLIVLDLNMPRLNGRQTLQHLKSDPRLDKITVVIFSTSHNPKEQRECLLLGAHSYIIKPVSFKESIEIASSFYDMCNLQ